MPRNPAHDGYTQRGDATLVPQALVLFPEPDTVPGIAATQSMGFRCHTGKFWSYWFDRPDGKPKIHAGAGELKDAEEFQLVNLGGGWTVIRHRGSSVRLRVNESDWSVTAGARLDGGLTLTTARSIPWNERFLILPLGRGFPAPVAIAVQHQNDDIMRFLSADLDGHTSQGLPDHLHATHRHVGSAEKFWIVAKSGFTIPN